MLIFPAGRTYNRTRPDLFAGGKTKLWKTLLLYILSVFLLLIVFPASLAGGWWRWESSAGNNPAAVPWASFSSASETEKQTLKIYHTEEKKMMELPLEEYVAGVVAAEMPASFHPEALKAQAVIARTYALMKAGRPGGGCTENPGADLCTRSTCCQAWQDSRAATAKWPAEKASFYLERIADAVDSTQGMVLVYQGNLAQAVYHSTCGGITETAAEAWSGNENVPYLRNVECSFCRHSPHYTGKLEMSLTACTAAIGKGSDVLPVLGEGNMPLLEVVRKSSSGRNMLLKIGGFDRFYRGEEIRNLLGLPSTFFSWQVKGEQIVFSTRGYGHGVGLCQYGADGMGSQGYNCLEILELYYPGTEVQLLE